MNAVEIAAILIAVAFALLVGYLVPLLIQVRKTVAESEQLLSKMNADMPALVSELRAMSQNLNDLAEQARGGVLLTECWQQGCATMPVCRRVRGARRGRQANFGTREMTGGNRA